MIVDRLTNGVRWAGETERNASHAHDLVLTADISLHPLSLIGIHYGQVGDAERCV